MDGETGCISIAVIILWLVVGIFSCGCYCGQSMTRSEAVKVGAGEWTVDPKTGTTKFEFKSAEEKP